MNRQVSIFGMLPFADRPFHKNYRAFTFTGNEHQLDAKNLIILPRAAKNHLKALRIQTPYTFELNNYDKELCTHSGVDNFSLFVEKVYLPKYMMDNLKLNDGDILNVQAKVIPFGNHVHISVLSEVKIWEIRAEKEELEKVVKNFACLTEGDVYSIKHKDKLYKLKVLQTKPQSAIKIDPHADISIFISFSNVNKESNESSSG